MSASTPGVATIIQSSAKHPPILTAGKITPAVAHVWENVCLQYFKHNDVTNDKKVAKVTGGFQDAIMTDLLAAFHSHFLPKGWDSAILTQLLRARQKEDESFEDWVLSIEKLNTTLHGMTSHLDDARLHAQISANVCEDLRFTCDKDEVKTIASFKDWKDKLTQLDTVRMREQACALARTKVPPLTTTKGNASHLKGPKLPPLTDEELKLLRDNDRCFKCRKFFVPKKERGCNRCTDTFPDASSYRTLTQADVESAHHAKGKENVKSRANVAAVSESIDDVTYNVGAINVNSTPLATTTGVLGMGSDSEPEYVQLPLTPFTIAHIPWSGIVHSPCLDSDPLPMLIDSGSPAVLIRSELISCLESKDSVEWVKL
ncbi:hypothetical protein BKA93DRAFT_822908 [Sparassis latifolia]